MYGIFNAVNMRSARNRKQVKEERQVIKNTLSEKLIHGDFKIIERRIEEAARVERENNPNSKAGKMCYNSVRYTLDPKHNLYCKRVIKEAISLLQERGEQLGEIASLDEYSSIHETAYLLKSGKNKIRLMESTERSNIAIIDDHELEEQ